MLKRMMKSLRYRKALASLILGAWAFGLFVGIAHACGWDGVTAMQHDAVAAGPADRTSPDGVPPGCEKFCNDDLPLVAKLRSVQDSPAVHSFVVPVHQVLGFTPITAPILRPALAARPPPDVPLPIRFLRLTL